MRSGTTTNTSEYMCLSYQEETLIQAPNNLGKKQNICTNKINLQNLIHQRYEVIKQGLNILSSGNHHQFTFITMLATKLNHTIVTYVPQKVTQPPHIPTHFSMLTYWSTPSVPKYLSESPVLDTQALNVLSESPLKVRCYSMVLGLYLYNKQHIHHIILNKSGG